MKNLFLLTIIFLLVACTAAPTEVAIQNNLIQTQIPEIENTQPPVPTNTIAQKPTTTSSPTAEATAAPTVTQIPSATTTPTQDLSFYDLASCIPKNTTYQIGKVTQVIDGDTISVLLEDGKTYSVRYIGMDAPEEDRPFSLESYNANSGLVDQKEVILVKDVSETDQYDRYLRYVIAGDVFINLEMVRTGFAQAEKYPPDTACAEAFSSAEAEARAAILGMWVATPTAESVSLNVIIVTVNKKDEWVDIKNAGEIDVDLAGWNLVSERGNQDCPLAGIIKAGEILRIWAMKAQGEGYSCGYRSQIFGITQNLILRFYIMLKEWK